MQTENNSNLPVIEWDDFIDEDFEVKSYFRRKKKETLTANDMEDPNFNIQATGQKIKAQEVVKEKYALSKDPLMKDAREKLEYYLKKIPSVRNTLVQIELLEKELNNYKKIGDTEKYQATYEMIKTLQEKTTQIKQVFAPKEGVKLKEKNEAIKVKIENSEKIKELKKRERELKKNLENTPNKIVTKLAELRKFLKYKESDLDILDFDDIISERESPLYTDYMEILTKIENITGISTDELNLMPNHRIKEVLMENIDLVSNNEELLKVRSEIQNEKDTLAGALSLSNIVNSLYDIRDTDNENDIKSVKEIMASKYISYVKGIAYRICMSSNAMHYYDDCLSAGLLALTEVVNNWISMQQIMQTNLSIKGMINVKVSNVCKRELWSQQSGGRLSGSAMADYAHREKKLINNFIEHNPEWANFDKNFIKDLITSYDTNAFKQGIGAIVSESEILAGGEDADGGADIWSNLNKDVSEVDMIEAKSEYNQLMIGINTLLKSLNKFERKLFMLYYGFEKKLQSESKSLNYTQEEIGRILFKFYRENGGVMKGKGDSFSQPAIYAKVKNLESKIAQILNENPSLREAFDYMMQYWLVNSDALKVLSDGRDEIGIKMERDTFKERIAEIEDEDLRQKYSNIQLVDGSTIGSEYNVSDYNPLDDSDVEDFYDYMYGEN